ncbi:MAG TPA: class I SAM-dependent methyltransferase, partial [bacterium]
SLAAAGKIVGTRDVTAERLLPDQPQFTRVLEHDAIPYVSYPYEWPFPLLQSAALLHLDIQLEALAKGVALSDATAYNVQFRGPTPVFIDILSFRPYRPGELWPAHRQFCEQFLNPLLLQSLFGFPHNAWYRGALEGIDTEAIAALMPRKAWFSPRALFHVLLPARAQQRLPGTSEAKSVERVRKAALPQEGYAMMLRQLRRWIAGLTPARTHLSTWEDYHKTRTYDDPELNAKRAFVGEFAAATKPGMIWDIGCNDGEFLEIALKHGAGTAIGFDADQGALLRAHQRATTHKINLLPLFQDAVNPSPGQGWRNAERAAWLGRARPDAAMFLAVIHHVAIGRNVPLADAVAQLVGIAPKGVIEFVHKDDPTVVRMLALREDIFPDYHQAAFEAALTRHARIVKTQVVSRAKRQMYWFERFA